MRVIHIKGMAGSGKSTVGRELARRGYYVIEADDFSAWVNTKTGKSSPHNPPFTKTWLNSHVWQWNLKKINELLVSSHEVTFIVGNSENDNLLKFDRVLALYINNREMEKRLKKRNPVRWGKDQNSIELDKYLLWNNNLLDRFDRDGIEVINGDQSTARIADQILGRLK